MKKSLIAITVGWPLIHLAIFVGRFAETPPLWELLYFMPTGLLGGLLLGTLRGRAQSDRQRKATLAGFVALVPMAVAGNILGGLLGPVGVTVFGLVPLALGTVAGFLIGKFAAPDDVGASGE